MCVVTTLLYTIPLQSYVANEMTFIKIEFILSNSMPQLISMSVDN